MIQNHQKTLRGIIGSFLVVFGCMIMAFCFHGIILPFMIIWPWAYRRLSEMFLSVGLTFLVAINEKLHNIKVKACGDQIARHEKTVVIMNHRTRLDWMYFFTFLYHLQVLNRQKITLKSAIKWAPVIGWSLQAAGYIFLARNAKEDEDNIRRSLTYFEEIGCKPNILIFPEGTDLSPSNKKRSLEYSVKNGLDKYDFVLHPKVKGFVWYVQTLRQVGGIQSVYDITVGYPDEIISNETDILFGKVPNEVHFHVKRYSIKKLPYNEHELAEWIKKRWLEKEDRLKKFYDQNTSKKQFEATYIKPNKFRAFFLWFVFIIWCFAICLFVYGLFSTYILPTYCLLLILLFISTTCIFGGLLHLEMLLYEKLHKPFAKWASKKV